jgi:3-phenylpropionate/trans-cinnamate dioxygenase ferredoxin subunit
MSDVNWTRVAAEGECPPGQLLGVEASGTKVVIANVDGDLYALKDRCSHADFPLSDGGLDGTHLECVHHGAKYDVCSGRALSLPAIRPVPAFEVEVRDGDIYIAIP